MHSRHLRSDEYRYHDIHEQDSCADNMFECLCCPCVCFVDTVRWLARGLFCCRWTDPDDEFIV